MVTWLAGNRIRGSNSERLNTTGIGNKVGGWKELGRTILGTSGDTIDVTNLANKRYLMVLNYDINQDANSDTSFRRYNGSSSGYATRANSGGSEYTKVSDTEIETGTTEAKPHFTVGYIANYATKEKLELGWECNQKTAGATTAPQRTEYCGKWDNTTNAINQVSVINLNTGSFAIGSECVVLGYDPDDTHTINFWEELGSTTLGAGSTDLDITSFTAKKYLWVQMYLQGTAFSEPTMTFNNDTTTYAWNRSANGGVDATSTSQAHCGIASGIGGGAPMCFNMFIINNSANEKLGISHCVSQFTAGAGTAPDRNEVFFKWDDTTSQINRIDVNSASGNFGIGSTLRVWGAN